MKLRLSHCHTVRAGCSKRGSRNKMHDQELFVRRIIFIRSKNSLLRKVFRKLSGGSKKDQVFFFLLEPKEALREIQRLKKLEKSNLQNHKHTMNRDQLYAYASSKLARVGGTRDPHQPRLPARPTTRSRSLGPTPPPPSSADESHFSAYFSLGKQKLISAVKTTKESSYYKSISTAIQQNFTNDPSVPLIPENPEIADDAEITMYKSYSRFTGTEYVTEIVGSVASPGTMTRKNRLLISLVQKLAKSNGASTATVNQFEHELKDSIANPEIKTSNTEDSDTASTYSTSLASSNSTDIIKDRLQGVMSRSAPRTPLKITVGSDVEVDHLLGAHLYTDPIGFFQISIATPYPPSYIVVSSTVNPEIMQTTQANIIEPTGVSVISDVDDTVRVTGVTAERREVFRNIFAKDFSECEVPGLGECVQYRFLVS
ncbi:unnamed protein product [Ambrosiozyma monospora]|uniref:Unnamed protein product n=1 Tax=Ambrosiozyma monospora TaxID=43982 RepID=A0ACB5T486_AMBMO|nr:unnamed protein product [Ambrosiozyma monospora]